MICNNVTFCTVFIIKKLPIAVLIIGYYPLSLSIKESTLPRARARTVSITEKPLYVEQENNLYNVKFCVVLGGLFYSVRKLFLARVVMCKKPLK